MPAVPSVVFCTSQDIQDVLSQEGINLRLDDNRDGSADSTELTVLDRAIYKATAQVKRYCQKLYNDADLATSWTVTEWTAVCAARRICGRRGNPCPDEIKDVYEEIVEELKGVSSGSIRIEDIGYRNPDWPAWSNTTTDIRYRYAKTRVERSISEKSPTQYGQRADWGNASIFEP